MTLYEGDGESVHVPTAKQEVFDNQGAGDTIIAALAVARSAGADLLLAAVLANAAAGCVVQKSGTATASPAEVRGILPAVLDALAESGDGS